ncbi:MFS transporter [Lysinibacillus piscis]|uniref:3-phenylpropionic acid transporter n=1 Tax=Lysinibacillus piscis TaxID=2518931 RepID=A0ABQ5NKW6_9BACI|nr:MFS transporter [Lysinibacillus sp. KH24]GLC89004.1 3-phenylpropionic acid transporter [Lysinibacillus sp. KH24]
MNKQRWLSQSFFTFFFTWGIFIPYWTGWLVDAKQLTVSQASIIMGCGLLARAVSNLFIFPSLSKYMHNKQLMTLLTTGALIIVLLYIPSSTFAFLLIVTVLFSMVYPAIQSVIESGAAILVQQGHIHYGKSRSYGSLGFIVAVLIISMLTGVFGDTIIFWSMVVGLIGILLMQQLETPQELLVVPTKEQRAKSLSMKKLWAYKSLLIVLLVVILLQGSHASYYNYAYIYLGDLHVNPFYMGMILNIAVICEILYFMKADTLFKGWRSSSLLLLAASGSSVRWLLIYLFPNVWVFIASQTLHALSFALAHFAFINYISKNLPKEQIPNAQGLYSALAMGLSTAILTFLGGYLYEITPGLAFLAMLICTIPAIGLILLTRTKYQY